MSVVSNAVRANCVNPFGQVYTTSLTHPIAYTPLSRTRPRSPPLTPTPHPHSHILCTHPHLHPGACPHPRPVPVATQLAQPHVKNHSYPSVCSHVCTHLHCIVRTCSCLHRCGLMLFKICVICPFVCKSVRLLPISPFVYSCSYGQTDAMPMLSVPRPTGMLNMQNRNITRM